MPQPKLIITADDYGMSPLFNRGIEELAFLGLITGISVMIKRPFIEAAKLPFPNLSLGLHLELEEISSKKEITAQIASFQQKFGKLPEYLDGHQHKHLNPKNLTLVASAARHFSLPVRSRFDEDRKVLQQRHIITPDHFISWHPDRLSVLAERLATAKNFPLSELVVHPGYFDPACDYPYNQERESEILFLKSDQFQKLISPFRLVSYLELI